MTRIGLLGASGIAPLAIIQPAGRRDDCDVVCVAARDGGKARDYASQHGIADAVEGYEALLAREDIDLVYNGLMQNRHADLSIAAVDSGKAVLCEKPFAMNAGEAEAMVAASERTRRPLIEAFHYRHHPAFRALEVALPRLGPLREVSGRFTVPLPPEGTRFDLSLGGGSLMDLGCYPLHALRTLCGTEPMIISAEAVEGPAGIDESITATLDFEGVKGTVHSDMSATAERGLNLHLVGRDGEASIMNFVHPYRGHHITVADEIVSEGTTERTTFDYQLDHVLDVMAGKADPLTGGADALANMRAIDAIYRAAGMQPRGLAS